jgi:hypothetical protein
MIQIDSLTGVVLKGHLAGILKVLSASRAALMPTLPPDPRPVQRVWAGSVGYAALCSKMQHLGLLPEFVAPCHFGAQRSNMLICKGLRRFSFSALRNVCVFAQRIPPRDRTAFAHFH